MFDLGLEGGPNASTLTGNSKQPIEPAIFSSAGFIFQYNCKNFLSFKTGLSYQRKGYQMKNITLTDENNMLIDQVRFSSKMDYLTFPLLVKANFGEKVQFFVNAGPYIGYMIGKSNEMKGDAYNHIKKGDFNGINRWDFGITGGVGIAIPIRVYWVVTVELRNYTGLTDIIQSNFVKQYTNTTDLRIGVAYKLGFYKDY